MATEDGSPRRLVVCCDGTNNTLTGGVHDTNVLRLFTELRRSQTKGRVLYYDPGVGSPDELPSTDMLQLLRRKWDRIAGLASGQGIFENVAQAYLFLMREWREGDEIWLFGFSRGAFTARSVAGMVHLFGILRPEHEVMLPTLLRVYFSSKDGGWLVRAFEWLGSKLWAKRAPRTRDGIADQVRMEFASAARSEASVHFVGVWDTVESVGLPGFGLRISSQATIKEKRIRHVRHALSLDEHRRPFLPRLYVDKDFDDPVTKQSMRQIWFRGAHSDVGGGYKATESGLSNDALEWMVEQAIACGLGCRAATEWEELRPSRLAHDPVYATPWWAVVGMTVRTPDRVVGKRNKGVRLAPVAHPSVTPTHPTSVWRSRRSAWPMLASLMFGAFALGVSGYMLTPGSGWGAFGAFLVDPSSWLHAAGLASELAWAQATAWMDATRPFTVVSAIGACPRWALLWDVAFIACYAYLLARLCSRAFSRFVGWREVDSRARTWLTKFVGASLGLLVGGDLLEDLLACVGFTIGRDSIFGPGSFCVGVCGAIAKFVGLAGCSLLLVLGIRDRGRGRSPRTS